MNRKRITAFLNSFTSNVCRHKELHFRDIFIIALIQMQDTTYNRCNYYQTVKFYFGFELIAFSKLF